ncbi:hypothetical protein GCM10027259_30060 [Micromonospora palomenae]
MHCAWPKPSAQPYSPNSLEVDAQMAPSTTGMHGAIGLFRRLPAVESHLMLDESVQVLLDGWSRDKCGDRIAVLALRVLAWW